jgi:cytochrome c553
MKKLVSVSLIMGVVASAMALSTFVKVFDTKYDVKADSNLGKAKCGTCHVKTTGGKLNPYGKDLAAAMKAENSKKLTAAILGKVEDKDSDGDGKKNGAEIKADSNPGS